MTKGRVNCWSPKLPPNLLLGKSSRAWKIPRYFPFGSDKYQSFLLIDILREEGKINESCLAYWTHLTHRCNPVSFQYYPIASSFISCTFNPHLSISHSTPSWFTLIELDDFPMHFTWCIVWIFLSYPAMVVSFVQLNGFSFYKRVLFIISIQWICWKETKHYYPWL